MNVRIELFINGKKELIRVTEVNPKEINKYEARRLLDLFIDLSATLIRGLINSHIDETNNILVPELQDKLTNPNQAARESAANKIENQDK